MFTGLIQQCGTLRALNRPTGGAVLAIACAPWETPLIRGESVAVQGACLTVTRIRPDGFDADVLDETLACTALAALRPGDRLNLERALRAGDRLGGHFVTGHIDETGRFLSRTPRGRDAVLRIASSRDFALRTVQKGSVALDGVSLTVSALGADWFEVNIIPTTLADTSLADRRPGDPVNLESDLIGKYTARFCGLPAAPGSLSEEHLAAAGFLD